MPPSDLPTIKVIHILHSLRFSGAEVMLRLAAHTFQAEGFESHILSDGQTVGDYAPTLREAGFIVHHRPFVNWSIPHLWRLYKFLKKHQFSVIHNHTEQNFIWYLVVARLAGISHFVSTVHNVFIFHGQVRLRRGIYRWVARHILGTQFTAIGPSVAQVEASIYKNPTTLIPNWLDEQRFVPAHDILEKTNAREHFGISSNTIAIISVGGCSKIKNHEAILETLVILQSKITKPLLYLHVGEGSTHADEQKQANQLGIAHMVRFIGQLHDVRQALIAADIFVMPSLFEGLGNSLLEALSCGVPAVVYDVYGLRDLVIDGKTGRCVPPNTAALTDALQEMIERPDLRKKYGEAGREFVLRNYSMNQSLIRLLPLYGITTAEVS